MKRVLIIIGVIVVLLIAVVVALPFIVPKSAMTAYVVGQIEEATGRKVTVGAEPEFSVFPEVKLSLSKVTLSNAEGGEAENLAEIGEADIEVDLMAALSGEVVIQKFVLIDPIIVVEKDKQGRFNFEMGDTGQGTPSDSGSSSAGEGGLGDGLKLSLDDVRLQNATLVYADATTGERQEIKGFNASLSLPAITGPFDVEADAEWQNRRVALVAHVDNPIAIANGERSTVKANVSSDGLFRVEFEGAVTGGDLPSGAGRTSISVEDLAGLLAWVPVALGNDVKLPATIGIAGDLTGSPEKVALANATVSFDDNSLKGNISAGLTGGKPFAVADLTAGALDLRAYLPEGGAGGGGAGAGGGSAGSDDWSDEPIDLSGLTAADIDIRLRADQITTGIVDTARTDVAFVAKGKQADLTINELNLYEGAATGSVNIDQRQAEPAIAIILNISNMQARPALQQLADYGDFLGTVNAAANLTTRGNTERKLVTALNGKGNVVVTDGAILGYNLAAAVRNISTGGLDMNYDESEKTDFAEISASFTAKNGVVNNPDLKMNAPLLRVTGQGDVLLPPKTIDYRALPKLVASLTGQGASESGGLGIPILITGAWADPSIKPDLEGVVKGVLQAPGDAVKGVADTVKGVGGAASGGVKGVLDSVTGSGSSSGETTPEKTEGDSDSSNPISGATKKLKGLFGN
ncbi:MAG: AsmA family protein [Minwuia sp.]|uniref:AsmA family protein n=1 Tax=Minwuia sp. TaxID=2493630 RepID=UPI003A88BD47